MSCNIVKNSEGEVVEVRANDGSISLLYKELENQFGQEQALDMFLASHSDAFETIYPQPDIISNETITQEIIDRLKQTGLAEDVFLMSTQEIENKLAEIGEKNVKSTTAGFVVKEYPSNSKILDILISKNIIEKVC